MFCHLSPSVYSVSMLYNSNNIMTNMHSNSNSNFDFRIILGNCSNVDWIAFNRYYNNIPDKMIYFSIHVFNIKCKGK